MQAEERAQLCLASKKQSHMLRLRKSDCVLYAARVIPGNDKQVGHLCFINATPSMHCS